MTHQSSVMRASITYYAPQKEEEKETDKEVSDSDNSITNLFIISGVTRHWSPSKHGTIIPSVLDEHRSRSDNKP